MSKVSIPFGKKTIAFPHNPIQLRNLIMGLVADRGNYSIDNGFGGTYTKDGLVFIVDFCKKTREWSVSVFLYSAGTIFLNMEGVGEDQYTIRTYLPGSWEQIISV